MINTADWYWFVGTDTSMVYSSKRNIYVNAATDTDYLAWANTGAAPVTYSEAQLWNDYMSSQLPAWMFDGVIFSQPAVDHYRPAQLIAYAELKQTKVAQGGFTVNANANASGETPLNIKAATAPPYDGYLSSAVIIAQLMAAGSTPAANINWSQSGVSVALSPLQVIAVGLSVAALVQASFTTLSQLISAIQAGTITTTAQIDNPPAPIQAWPVNS